MRFHLILLLLAFPISSFALDIAISKTEWTAKTGSKIQGRLMSYESGTLKLKKADGSIISIPESLLIESDIDFIKKLIEDSSIRYMFIANPISINF